MLQFHLIIQEKKKREGLTNDNIRGKEIESSWGEKGRIKGRGETSRIEGSRRSVLLLGEKGDS